MVRVILYSHLYIDSGRSPLLQFFFNIKYIIYTMFKNSYVLNFVSSVSLREYTEITGKSLIVSLSTWSMYVNFCRSEKSISSLELPTTETISSYTLSCGEHCLLTQVEEMQLKLCSFTSCSQIYRNKSCKYSLKVF